MRLTCTTEFGDDVAPGQLAVAYQHRALVSIGWPERTTVQADRLARTRPADRAAPLITKVLRHCVDSVTLPIINPCIASRPPIWPLLDRRAAAPLDWSKCATASDPTTSKSHCRALDYAERQRIPFLCGPHCDGEVIRGRYRSSIDRQLASGYPVAAAFARSVTVSLYNVGAETGGDVSALGRSRAQTGVPAGSAEHCFQLTWR